MAMVLLGVLCAGASANFILQSISVTIEAQKNGDAHIVEKISMFLDSQDSVDLYKSSLGISDIASWRSRIGLSDIRFHVSTAEVGIVNLRIKPQPVERCSTFDGTCWATMILDYTATPLYNKTERINTTGVFFLEQGRPRTTRYSINPQAISLKRTDSGDILLDPYVTLTIIIPSDSVVESLQPIPSDLADTVQPPFKGVSTFTWKNAILPKFELVFTREDTLESEIIQFFNNYSNRLTSFFLGPEGLALVVIILVVVASYVYLNTVEKKHKA